jgi:hypothetical protein
MIVVVTSVWAVMQDLAYTGSFLDSLWISKEGAETEAARRTAETEATAYDSRGVRHVAFSVEEIEVKGDA